MAYSKDVYETVKKKLEDIRKQKQLEAAKKRNDFFKNFPRAKELELELSKLSIKIAKIIILKGDFYKKIQILKAKNLSLQQEIKTLEKKFSPKKDFFKIDYQCKVCEDTGCINGLLCECIKIMLKKEVYERLNMLSPIALCSFDNFSLSFYSSEPFSENPNSNPKKRMKKIFSFCKNYTKTFSTKSKNLLFQGATGLGKTHLSLAIAKEIINQRFGVIYGSTQNLISSLEKERFSHEKINENENYSKSFAECDLLILDDLGVEFSRLDIKF